MKKYAVFICIILSLCMLTACQANADTVDSDEFSTFIEADGLYFGMHIYDFYEVCQEEGWTLTSADEESSFDTVMYIDQKVDTEFGTASSVEVTFSGTT